MITQPDKPAGRGQREDASPVKQRAVAASVPVLQPPRLRDPGWPERLAEYRADVAVVVAFGQILPKAVLDVPVRGSINVHALAAAALPRRGADRVGHHPRRDGDRDHHLPDGPGHGHRRHAPERGDADRPRGDGRRALRATGGDRRAVLLRGRSTASTRCRASRRITRRPRSRRGSTRKTAGCGRHEPARDLVNRVRGCNPWPGAALVTPGGRLLIWRARRDRRGRARARRRPRRLPRGGLAIGTGDGPARARSRSSRRIARRCRGTSTFGRGSARRRLARRPARLTRAAPPSQPGSQGGPGLPGAVRGARTPGPRRAGPRLRGSRARGRARIAPRLDARDAGLCHRDRLTARCAGAGTWTGASRPHLNRPLAKLDPWVRAVLRLTAYQLLFLDRVPRWAAVDEAVSSPSGASPATRGPPSS